jgi:hypothetical protein
MKYEELKQLIEEYCTEALKEMEETEKLDKSSDAIADEILTLRKEVAKAWFFRHYDKHYRAFQYAQERFMTMDLKERQGRPSAEILKELSVEYIKRNER